MPTLAHHNVGLKKVHYQPSILPHVLRCRSNSVPGLRVPHGHAQRPTTRCPTRNCKGGGRLQGVEHPSRRDADVDDHGLLPSDQALHAHPLRNPRYPTPNSDTNRQYVEVSVCSASATLYLAGCVLGRVWGLACVQVGGTMGHSPRAATLESPPSTTKAQLSIQLQLHKRTRQQQRHLMRYLMRILRIFLDISCTFFGLSTATLRTTVHRRPCVLAPCGGCIARDCRRAQSASRVHVDLRPNHTELSCDTRRRMGRRWSSLVACSM